MSTPSFVVRGAGELGNAVGKAGRAVQKPVWGQRIISRWDEEQEEWVPETKESKREIPAWMAGLGVVVLAVAAVTVAGTAASTRKRLDKREDEENGANGG